VGIGYQIKRQVKDASSAAQQLSAEMLWSLLVFPVNIKPETKRDQIRELWALSGQTLPDILPMLSDEVLAGIGSGGPGFNNHRWRELTFLITLTGELKKSETPARHQSMEDYDAFMNWIER